MPITIHYFDFLNIHNGFYFCIFILPQNRKKIKYDYFVEIIINLAPLSAFPIPLVRFSHQLRQSSKYLYQPF